MKSHLGDKKPIKNYVDALRLESLTASLVPILVTTTVVGADILSWKFLRVLASGFLVQLGANLANTYYDFVQGCDNDSSANKGVGDLSLAKRKVTAQEVYFGMVGCYLLALFNEIPTIWTKDQNNLGKALFLSGMFLSFAYTANPFSFKYKGLGNLVVFLEFGPLLMQYAAVALTGSISDKLWIYTIPIGFSIDAILHANNVRDYDTDKAAGANTLVVLLGLDFAKNYLYFEHLIMWSSVIYIGLFCNYGCLAALLTLPLIPAIFDIFKPGTPGIKCVEECGKFQTVFGTIMALGIKFTEVGAV